MSRAAVVHDRVSCRRLSQRLSPASCRDHGVRLRTIQPK